jgi:hypothetical protein
VRSEREAGEPVSEGRVDRRATEARELRTALLGVAFFAAIVLVNAIVAIAFIALMQALGLWALAPAEAAFSSPDGVDELRTSLHSLTGVGNEFTGGGKEKAEYHPVVTRV